MINQCCPNKFNLKKTVGKAWVAQRDLHLYENLIQEICGIKSNEGGKDGMFGSAEKSGLLNRG